MITFQLYGFIDECKSLSYLQDKHSSYDCSIKGPPRTILYGFSISRHRTRTFMSSRTVYFQQHKGRGRPPLARTPPLSVCRAGTSAPRVPHDPDPGSDRPVCDGPQREDVDAWLAGSRLQCRIKASRPCRWYNGCHCEDSAHPQTACPSIRS